MMWSFSDSRIFRKCQRQWFYKEHFASDNPRNANRWEAFLLSKLQTVQSWRGHIVDDSIKNDIIPAISKGWKLNSERILENARKRFDKQLEFARNHRLREPGMVPSKAGESFAAFYSMEHGQPLIEAEITQAWRDVEIALTNLLSLDDLLARLCSANSLISQRRLTFSLGDINIQAVPDLIAFYAAQPPLIVDWKVHTFGTTDYRLQLMCYALALTRCKPHEDFPESLGDYDTTDVRLIEAQLLTNQLRQYSVSDSDIEEVELYIFASATEMIMALGADEAGKVVPADLPPTDFPETCQRCAFRSLCWKEASPWDLKQMSLL